MYSQNSFKSRPPAVADQFYPAEATQLAALLKEMMDAAKPSVNYPVKAIIVPHAGYVYSGPVAASAYQAIKHRAHEVTRVVLMGPSHRVGFHGIATTSVTEYSMPFGAIKIDRAAVNMIATLPQVQQLDEAHKLEHSLEVQLPFLQSVLDSFTLVPLVVGECTANQVAEVLEMLWGGEETLIVISSDLSHYHSYDTAREMDRRTSDAILGLSPDQIHYADACGRNPVNGLLLAAKHHQLKPNLIDLRNAGDTAGTRDRVVGYGAYLFSS